MADPTQPTSEVSLLRRLRPYLAVAVVVVIGVVVLVVSSGGGDDDDSTTDDTVASDDDAATDDDDAPSDDDASTDDDSAAADDDDDVATTTTGPPVPEFPGVGTDAALENPNCDPETGRIRIPVLSAPPCVVEWPAGADNGGETAAGVTADTIVMVIRVDAGATEFVDDAAAVPDGWRNVIEIYNGHYEFSGRQVQLEFVETSGSTEVAQRADATRAINDFAPFLTHDATTDGEGRAVYEAEMAARGVIVWGAAVSWQETQDQAGFRWAPTADDRVTVLHVAEYVGNRVAGRPVQWAGDDLIGEPRQIGLIHTDKWDKDFFDEQAAANGFEVVEAVSYDESLPSVQRQERARVIAARMKDAGVTTVIAGTDSLFTGLLTQAATDQQWFPEWIITGYSGQDAAFFARGYDQDQWANAFGPGPIGTSLAGQQSAAATLFRWHHGRDTASLVESQAGAIVAWPMACLHLAGPELTPETFADGCFAMPPSLGSYCGCVTSVGATFGDERLPWTDYTAFDDMTEKWWDPTHEQTNNAGIVQVGGYQTVDGGRRYAVGEWTDEDPRVFEPEGAVARYEDPPPNDTPPEYEHEAHG